MKKDVSKLISLWINSTFGLIQLLIVGVAIEGNWMKIHKYMLDRIYVPNAEEFLAEFKNELDEFYNKIAFSETPSLKIQLETGHKIRKEIDKFFIKTLNIEIWKRFGKVDEFQDLLQTEFLNELKNLCPSDFE